MMGRKACVFDKILYQVGIETHLSFIADPFKFCESFCLYTTTIPLIKSKRRISKPTIPKALAHILID